MAIPGLVALLAGWLLMFVLPGARPVAWGVTGLGVALLAAAVLMDFRRVRGALSSRRGRFGLGSAVRICLFAGVMVLVNVASTAVSFRIDATGLAQFTLTSQTRDVLAKLDAPVEVVQVFTPRVPSNISGYARNLLREYGVHTDKLSVTEIDPDISPDLARQYGVDRLAAIYGVVLFRSGAHQRMVYGPQIIAEAEHAFTSALLEVTGTRQKTVYFLTGNEEGHIAGDFSEAVNGLRDNLFRVAELNLTTTPAIPEDAAALIVAGPLSDFSPNHEAVLAAYLRTNGRALVLLDPNASPGLRRLLLPWGIEVANGMLTDPASFVEPDEDTVLVPGERNGWALESYFPGAAALIPSEELPEELSASPLAWTSAEAGCAEALATQPDPEGPLCAQAQPPYAVGVLITTAAQGQPERQDGTRLAVIGDSDFASNRHFQNVGNARLFLTAINWLTEDKEVISVDRKVLDSRRLVLSPEQARLLQISSIGLLPLLLLMAGGVVWWRRRN